MEFANEIVGAQHPAHAVGERERDSHRKPFGHAHHYKRDSNHKRLEQICEEGDQLEGRIHMKIHDDTADYHGRANDIAHAGYKAPEPVELLGERSADRIVDARRLENLAVLGIVAYGSYACHTMPLHHPRAT